MKTSKSTVAIVIIIIVVLLVIVFSKSSTAPVVQETSATSTPVVTIPAVTSPFVLSVGSSVKVGSDIVKVTEVTDDSRCPALVQCIQAGAVHVAVSVDVGTGNPATSVLAVGEHLSTGSHVFTLESVNPPRMENKTLVASDYRFLFSFVAK